MNMKFVRTWAMLALVMVIGLSVTGGTIAWFTDSVTSANNVITSGDLDVEVYYGDPAAKNSIQDVNALFKGVTLWEPGAVAWENLTVANEGNLALKYQMVMNSTNENTVNGYGLSSALKVGFVDGEISANATREDVKSLVNGTWHSFSSFNTSGMLLPTDTSAIDQENIPTGAVTGSKTYGMVIYWEPTAEDNNWNVNNGKITSDDADHLHIDLGVSVQATQLTAEDDSFGPDYDANAEKVVKPGDDLRAILKSAPAGSTVYLQEGVHTINNLIDIDGKSLNVVGLGDVTIKATTAHHMFTLQDSVNPNSDVVFNISNINLDGGNVSKHGFNVKYNVTLNLSNVTVKNTSTGWANILLDNGNKFTGENAGKYFNDTETVVNLYNTHVESVAMNALPCTSTSTEYNTYATLNYDAGSTIGSIEKQSICTKPDNLKVNEGVELKKYFRVTSDSELAAALKTIKGVSEYWNTPVTVELASGTYSGDHVINQYPTWNGIVGAGGTSNNMSALKADADVTTISFIGEGNVRFTGNVTVNGWGNAGNGFDLAKASTSFKNVTFDAANSIESNGEDYIALYLKAAANNVTFDDCTFENATHITLGGAAADGVGKVTFNNCDFNDGGCLSGYVETLDVNDCTVTAAKNGFINKSKAGIATVNNSTINAGKYFLRTSNSGAHLVVNDSTITLYESEGKADLVNFRGSNESATFTNCNLPENYTNQGVDSDSTLTINN